MDTWRSKEDAVRSGTEESPIEVVRLEPKVHGSLMEPLRFGKGQEQSPGAAPCGDATAPTEPSPALRASRGTSPDPKPGSSDSGHPASSPPTAAPASPRRDCPTEHQIQAFVEGHVSDAEREMLNAHIDECNSCLDLVGALADSSPRESNDSFGTIWPTTIGRGALLAERFDVLHFVAKGGMGEVYEAFDRNLQERVALKTMLCTSADTEATLQQLRDEVRLARRIAHRNVCRIHELHVHRTPEDEGATVQFVAMEFVPGETLKARLAEGPLPLPEVISIGRQLLDGLEAAHTAGVLHLDFKSQNVLLRAGSHPPEPVIMDFGLARAFEVEARLRTSERHVAGSAGYMSPEQIQCRPAGPRSDLYAFGVVLFEMLTGRLPFEGDTVASIMMKQLKSRTPVPSRVRPELPESFDELVVHLLHREPRSRPDTVASARRAFEACVRDSEAPQRSRRAKKQLLGGAVLLCSLLGTLVWRALQPAADTTATQALRPNAAAAVPSPASKASEEREHATPSPEPAVEEILPLPPPSAAPEESSPPAGKGDGTVQENRAAGEASSSPRAEPQSAPRKATLRERAQSKPGSGQLPPAHARAPEASAEPESASKPEPEGAQHPEPSEPQPSARPESEGATEAPPTPPAEAPPPAPKAPTRRDDEPPPAQVKPRQASKPSRATPPNDTRQRSARPKPHRPWRPGVPRDLL